MFATKVVVVAAAVGPILAVRRARRRLQSDVESIAEEEKVIRLSDLTELARSKRVSEMHSALCKIAASSEASALRLSALEDACSSTESLGDRCASASCGQLAKRVPWLDELCSLASTSSKRAQRTRADVVLVQQFVFEQRVELLTMDVECEARAALPPDIPPWRAPWQKRERAADAAWLVSFARQRSQDGLAPIDAYVSTLEQLVAKASDTIAKLPADDRVKLSAVRANIASVLSLLHSTPELYAERREAARLAEAKRSADAAVKTEAETRKLRLATEDAAREKRRCARAVEKLADALQAYVTCHDYQHTRTCPSSLADCANTEDPISLEPLSRYPLADLCLLPSRNCMRTAHLIQMRSNIDPFTNLELPSGFRNTQLPACANGRHADAIGKLVQHAKVACR